MSAYFNHGLMEIAREAAGIPQAALAKKIGCTQATISRWEHGLFRPSDDELQRLSGVLNVSVSFFAREDALFGGGLPVFYHRALAAASSRTTSQVNARCFLRAMQVETLCKLCPPNEHDFPVLPSDRFDEGVPRVAQAVRAAWNIGPGPVHNLVGLIESKGGIVIIEDLGCDEVDALCWWRSGLPKLFFLNARKPACRMRFSLAHELGHTIMHTEPTDTAIADREADAFAGEFLFPAKEARAILTRPLKLARLASLKPWWKISIAALAVRACESGVITKQELATLMKEIAANGWRKREPVVVEYEKPSAFSRLLRYPLANMGLSREELAEVLDTTVPELNRMLGNNLLLVHGDGEQDDGASPDAPWLRLVGT